MNYKQVLVVIMDNISAEIENLRSAVESRKIELIKLENEIINNEKYKNDKINELENLINEKDGKLLELNMKIDGLKTEINQINKELSEKQQQIQLLTDEKEKYTTEIKDFEEKINKMNTDYKQKILELENKINELDEQLKTKESDLQKLKDDFQAEMKKEKERLEAEIEGLKTDFEEEKNKFLKEKEEILKEKENLFEEKEKILKELEEEKESSKIAQIDDNLRILNNEDEFIEQINNMLKEIKIRTIIIIPTIQHLEKIELDNLERNIIVNLSTHINMSDPSHKQIVKDLRRKLNITIKNYEAEDLWGLKKDGDELFLATKLESGNFFGFVTSDINNVNLFSGIITDATFRAKKIGV